MYLMNSIYQNEREVRIKMNRYPFITDEEFRSLLYYQGAIQNIDLKMLDTELTNFTVLEMHTRR